MDPQKPVHRHIELVPFGIFNEEEFALPAIQFKKLQAPVQADTVILMDDEIIGLQIIQRGNIGL